MAPADFNLADWRSFDADSPHSGSYKTVRPSTKAAPFKPTTAFRTRFPILTQLLNRSRQTELDTSAGRRHIHAWTDRSGKRFGWVCLPPPRKVAPAKMHTDHKLLLTAFGGIDHHWNGPDSFLDNQYGSLGVPHWSPGFGGSEDLFNDIIEDLIEEVPDYVKGDIVPADYAKFTSEANGDMTVYHIETAAILHIGFDCGCRGVTPLDAYEDLLFHINGVPDFASWVENVAQTWLSSVGAAA